jgi:hypothetical protein
MFGRSTLPLAAVLLCLAFAAHAAETHGNSPAKSSPQAHGTTNAAPLQVESAKSVFVVPHTPTQGKDPFFPLSTRLFSTAVITQQQTNKVVSVPIDLQLRGISGPSDHRLAIINTSTFETGEERDLRTRAGRVRVRCVEISEDSVVVQTGGERRVLRLRPGI